MSKSAKIAHNLPSQPTPFIGRRDELAEISRLLSDPVCRLLTLTGPGGIGKTRLTLEAARLIGADVGTQRTVSASKFPDGIHFIPLQPLTSPDFIVSAIADAIGLQFYGERDPKEQLFNYLREKSLLLILDNLEHLLDGVGLLPEILGHAPDIRILVTSRERLNLREEWVLDIGGLSYPANDAETNIERYSAVELFVQHARRVNNAFTLQTGQKPAVTRICTLVGGMPLGIELAAAWVRALSCDQIASELARGLDILETSTRNVEPRHRTMRAVFEPTWTRLSDEERAVFKKLSVFRGGFTREAAEYVAGANLRTLSSLVDKSLLLVDGNGRYDVHELLRQSADDQLERSGEAKAIRNAHCAYFAEFLYQLAGELKSASQIKALNEMEEELDNVRVSWHWAVTQSKEHEILQSIDSLALFYQIRSRFLEAEEAFGMAANRFGDTENMVFAQTLMLQGWFAFRGGHRHKGRELQAKGAHLMRQLGFHGTMAMLFGSLNISQELGDFQAVQQLYEDCLAIFRRIGDSWKTAWVLYGLGRVAYQSGQYEEAQRLLQESLATFRAIGDRWGSVYPLHTLGDWAIWRGDYREARGFLEESLLINKEIGDMAGVAWSQSRLASIADSLDEFGSSRKYLAEILKTRFQLGSSWGSSEDEIYLMARWLETQGQTERAVEMFAFLSKADLLFFFELRDKVTRRLDTLRDELPPSAFAAAVQRGEASDLETMVLALPMQLAALDEEIESTTWDTRYDSRLESQLLIEPLSERELEILHLLADGLNSREVAQRLVLSVGTIRWYRKQIYAKLDTHSRSQAIARARELNLLT